MDIVPAYQKRGNFRHNLDIRALSRYLEYMKQTWMLDTATVKVWRVDGTVWHWTLEDDRGGVVRDVFRAVSPAIPYERLKIALTEAGRPEIASQLHDPR